MARTDRDIHGTGQASPAAIRAAIVDRGRKLAKEFAPGGIYRDPLPGVEQLIIDAARGPYGPEFGIDVDGFTSQINAETAGLQSLFWIERANPGGLGAIDSAPGQAIDFTKDANGDAIPFHDAARLGLMAMADHLRNYAFGRGPWTPNDPRAAAMPAAWFGAAPKWRDLQGKYATSKSYSQTLEAIWTRLDQIIAEVGMGNPYDSIIPGMVDLRGELQRNPSGGPNRRRSLDSVRGLVVHFNGPDVGADDRAHIIAVAKYHCTKNFARAGDPPAIGDGIMYHVGITRAGEVLLQRDFEDVLWHCGNTEWNERSLSVLVPIGINQRATDAQLAALGRVADGWRRFTEDGRDLVKGHQELSPTNCPGSLMPDFVLPYRAGNDTEQPAPAEPGAQPDPWRFDNPFGTDYWILNPFVDWIHTHGGFMAVGYVRDGAFLEDGVLVQYFQRYRLEWHPENAPADRVLGALLGQEEYARRYPQGRAA